MARCSHCEDDRLVRCSYADCPFEVEEAQRANEAFQTRITELEAEVERLTKERDDALMVKREAVAGWRDAKSLSRTGAVKVSREEAEKLCARLEYDASWDKCGSGYYSMKRQLSALESAAPEGEQEAAEADRIRREMEEILRRQSERDIPFAPATRPSEQAVTEAAFRVCASAKLVDIGKNGAFNYVVSPYLIDALKAAMEAGR